ncbi:MAG: 2-keto-4-pentenoate hydratase [Acidimicrobiia bacterium]
MIEAEVLGEARRLALAWQNAIPVLPPTSRHEAFDRAAAYRVQDAVVELLAEDLGQRVGWKLGATSLSSTMEPFSGPLHAEMVVPSGGSIRLDRCIAPRVEVEVAIVLGEDVSRPLTETDAAALDFGLAAALEIIDDRTVGPTGDADRVADVATMRWAVIGPARRADLADASSWRASLIEDGTQVAIGTLVETINSPIESLIWLSRHLARRGGSLAGGDVILTGSLTGQHPPRPGSRYEGRVSGLASVDVEFVPGEPGRLGSGSR